jgi:hypothetical protein
MPDVIQTGNGSGHEEWINEVHVVDCQIVWILKKYFIKNYKTTTNVSFFIIMVCALSLT